MTQPAQPKLGKRLFSAGGQRRPRDRSSGSRAVRFYARAQTHAHTLRVYVSAKVISSLHGGERVGPVPMGAMALGEPVNATAWSGNMALIGHRSGCLVGYRPAPQKGNGGLCVKLLSGTQGLWAEPDLASAVEWTRRLFPHGGLRGSIGAAGLDAVGQC